MTSITASPVAFCGAAEQPPSSKCCPAAPAVIGAVLVVKAQAYLIYKGHTMGDPCVLRRIEASFVLIAAVLVRSASS